MYFKLLYRDDTVDLRSENFETQNIPHNLGTWSFNGSRYSDSSVNKLLDVSLCYSSFIYLNALLSSPFPHVGPNSLEVVLSLIPGLYFNSFLSNKDLSSIHMFFLHRVSWNGFTFPLVPEVLWTFTELVCVSVILSALFSLCWSAVFTLCFSSFYNLSLYLKFTFVNYYWYNNSIWCFSDHTQSYGKVFSVPQGQACFFQCIVHLPGKQWN